MTRAPLETKDMIFSFSSTGRARRGGSFVVDLRRKGDVLAMLNMTVIVGDYGDR